MGSGRISPALEAERKALAKSVLESKNGKTANELADDLVWLPQFSGVGLKSIRRRLWLTSKEFGLSPKANNRCSNGAPDSRPSSSRIDKSSEFEEILRAIPTRGMNIGEVQKFSAMVNNFRRAFEQKAEELRKSIEEVLRWREKCEQLEEEVRVKDGKLEQAVCHDCRTVQEETESNARAVISENAQLKAKIIELGSRVKDFEQRLRARSMAT